LRKSLLRHKRRRRHSLNAAHIKIFWIGFVQKFDRDSIDANRVRKAISAVAVGRGFGDGDEVFGLIVNGRIGAELAASFAFFGRAGGRDGSGCTGQRPDVPVRVHGGHAEHVRRIVLKRHGRVGAGDVDPRELRAGGIRRVHDALAWLECRTSSEHDAGDHTIFVGEVESTELGLPGQGLVYRGGEYLPA